MDINILKECVHILANSDTLKPSKEVYNVAESYIAHSYELYKNNCIQEGYDYLSERDYTLHLIHEGIGAYLPYLLAAGGLYGTVRSGGVGNFARNIANTGQQAFGGLMNAFNPNFQQQQMNNVQQQQPEPTSAYEQPYNGGSLPKEVIDFNNQQAALANQQQQQIQQPVPQNNPQVANQQQINQQINQQAALANQQQQQPTNKQNNKKQQPQKEVQMVDRFNDRFEKEWAKNKNNRTKNLKQKELDRQNFYLGQLSKHVNGKNSTAELQAYVKGLSAKDKMKLATEFGKDKDLFNYESQWYKDNILNGYRKNKRYTDFSKNISSDDKNTWNKMNDKMKDLYMSAEDDKARAKIMKAQKKRDRKEINKMKRSEWFWNKSLPGRAIVGAVGAKEAISDAIARKKASKQLKRDIKSAMNETIQTMVEKIDLMTDPMKVINELYINDFIGMEEVELALHEDLTIQDMQAIVDTNFRQYQNINKPSQPLSPSLRKPISFN